ncbi:MAG: TIR domain-containing protein [Candidatus Helarchaeota archaeon]
MEIFKSFFSQKHCGKEIPGNATYCPICGVYIGLYCEKCQKNIPFSRNCPYCYNETIRMKEISINKNKFYLDEPIVIKVNYELSNNFQLEKIEFKISDNLELFFKSNDNEYFIFIAKYPMDTKISSIKFIKNKTQAIEKDINLSIKIKDEEYPIKRILQYENDNNRSISKIEIVKLLSCDLADANKYYNNLNSPAKYEETEIRLIEKIGQWIIKEAKDFNLYEIISQFKLNLELGKKVGKYLMDNGFITEFPRFKMEYKPGKFTKTKKPISKHKNLIIFISYSTKDANLFHIKDISEKLEEYEEIEEVLYWQDDMKDNIYTYMNENLGRCDVFLLFCTPNALKSIPVEKEWTAADALNKKIIPIFINTEDIPPLLTSRLGLRFDSTNFDKNINEIYRLIMKKVE